ncbi:SRPBCC domain-containing protein [Klenkia sp. PcliD-1-E]|uniref:SRPBCC domain-containing protein n=1 Tax=Klenkia sp. PcliD-1-E TaxID=2954492 RepID=UPI002097025A|nr:SRPBCC domain-containing protein [Klenkia sp. PcliD-1-E]MCO7220585.1 SRPBCC domain-containing protein [Klenkia sp. PcliD-1-E]
MSPPPRRGLVPGRAMCPPGTAEEQRMTSEAQADGGVRGRVGAEGGEGVVRFEARCAAVVEEVWAALTDRHRLQQWLGDLRGDLRQGGAFTATFTSSGWEGTGQVEVCAPPHRLVVHTQSADELAARFEVTLTPDGGGTALVVEDHGLPLEQVAAYAAGDQIHVEDLLAHLAGRPRCEPRTRWAELHAVYLEQAATLG